MFNVEAKSQLKIKLTNVGEIEGDIYLGLFNKPDGFLEKEDQYRVVITPVTGDTMLITLDELPAGYYAISVMKDLDGDLKMDKNLIGIPKEPYGFSQNFHPRFSKPDFEDCSFYYDGKSGEMIIEMID